MLGAGVAWFYVVVVFVAGACVVFEVIVVVAVGVVVIVVVGIIKGCITNAFKALMDPRQCNLVVVNIVVGIFVVSVVVFDIVVVYIVVNVFVDDVIVFNVDVVVIVV